MKKGMKYLATTTLGLSYLVGCASKPPQDRDFFESFRPFSPTSQKYKLEPGSIKPHSLETLYVDWDQDGIYAPALRYNGKIILLKEGPKTGDILFAPSKIERTIIEEP